MAETGDQLLEEKQVSTRELLNRSAQDLIEEVNSKRKRDTTLLAGTTERLVWYALLRMRNVFLYRFQESYGTAVQ